MKKMLIVCDVEGTIFQEKYRVEGADFASSMWQPIAHALGPKAEREEALTHVKWEKGEYENYLEWVKDTVKIHKKYKLRRETFNRLIDEAEYMPGVVEFFRDLDRDKFIPVLITGGFMELARRAKRELNIESSNIFAACNYVFDIYGNLIDEDIKSCDFFDKYRCVKEVLSKYDLDEENDWIFIGDGKNDIEIASKAPYSLGINAHESLKKVVWDSVDNFKDAFDFINMVYDTDFSEIAKTPHQQQLLAYKISREKQFEQIVEENIRMQQEIVELNKIIISLRKEYKTPSTVEAIIPLAELYFGDYISFSKIARSSLIENARAGYKQKDIDEIFEQLYNIYTWVRFKKNEITKVKYEAEVSSLNITRALSESTEAQFGDDYIDSGVLIDMHITLKSLPNCDRPRIYFGWDEKHNKALISTMCEHKKTSKYH